MIILGGVGRGFGQRFRILIGFSGGSLFVDLVCLETRKIDGDG